MHRDIDPAWTPVIITPAAPAYLSGHSGPSAWATTGLTALRGPAAFEDSTTRVLARCAGRVVLERLGAGAGLAR